MSLLDRVKEIAKAQGKSMRQIEIGCGFSNGALTKWGTQSPSIDKVLSVADYLNVSLQFLVTGTESSSTDISSQTLSPGEQAIYEQVHPLSEPEKFKLAGALPFIRILQDAPMSVPDSAREHAAIGLFVGSTSRD